MTITGQDLIINRADMSDARIEPVEFPDKPPAGHALLKVDHFALTANTITYGVATDSLGYWNFFPSQKPGFGRIPAWGFADVVASSMPGVNPGQRLFGYVPMSTHLMIEPGRIDARGLSDLAPHRQAMAPIYNFYSFADADPAYAPEHEAHIALFRPLFTTSFLLADFFQKADMFGAAQIVMSSASSKTALGLAAELARTKTKNVRIIGLTSPGNAAFVRSLGLLDLVVRYDDIKSLDRDPTVYVDFSGNGELTLGLHKHFTDRMKHSTQVGLTDWQNANLRIPDLPGPKPEFFFAPSYAEKRIKDWGADGFRARLSEAWTAFIATTTWLRERRIEGPDAVRLRYLEALQGKFDPSEGEMLSMWTA